MSIVVIKLLLSRRVQSWKQCLVYSRRPPTIFIPAD